MDKGHLPFLITEDLFVLSADKQQTEQTETPVKDDETDETPVLVTDEANKPNNMGKLVFQGTAKNKLLIIIEQPLSDQTSELLNKMLGAVKFSLAEAALVVIQENTSLDINELKKEVIFDRLLYFGQKSIGDKIFEQEVAPYFPMLVVDKFCISADNLDLISSDVEKKKKLWDSMKKVFH